jgi:hypothetical protein
MSDGAIVRTGSPGPRRTTQRVGDVAGRSMQRRRRCHTSRKTLPPSHATGTHLDEWIRGGPDGSAIDTLCSKRMPPRRISPGAMARPQDVRSYAMIGP